jgi:ABC-type sugar transport system substrate-binding protein
MTVDVPPTEDAKFMSAYITDAYQLGYAVGEQIAKDLLAAYPTGEIEYGLIGGTVGNPVPTARNSGMRDAVAAIDTEGRIKESTFLYANAFTEESGLKTAENMLIAHPKLKAILGTCDAHVVGATAAAKRQGLDKDIIMGGVDGSKAAMQIMKDGGPIKVLALNSPIDVGRSAAREMVAFIVDGAIPVSKSMIIKGDTVTPKNVDEYIANAF